MMFHALLLNNSLCQVVSMKTCNRPIIAIGSNLVYLWYISPLPVYHSYCCQSDFSVRQLQDSIPCFIPHKSQPLPYMSFKALYMAQSNFPAQYPISTTHILDTISFVLLPCSFTFFSYALLCLSLSLFFILGTSSPVFEKLTHMSLLW